MEIKGKVHFIGEVTQVSDTFKKREFVIEFSENPQYPEFVKLEFIQDKCALLDTITLGSEVEVSFNLKGREWTNKQFEKQYFNTLQAWKINVLSDNDDTAF